MKILTNKKLNKEVRDFLTRNTVKNKLDISAWAWYELPSSDNHDYILLLEWQEGYDENDNTEFLKNGYGLNVSVRVDMGQYFKCDNPYPIANEHGDCIVGYSIEFVDVKNGFKDLTHALLHDYKLAIKREKFTNEFFD